MSNFTIRTADVNDVPLLQQIGRQTFSDTFSEFNTPENMNHYLDENFKKEKVEAEIRDPKAESILLYDHDRCIGFARLRHSENPVGIQGEAIEIERIYSLKDYIGAGVGSSLMQECLRRAEQKNCQVIWLGVWEHNLRAVRFYEKYGFEKFGDHVFMLGTDPQTDWLMKKKLNPKTES